MLLTKQFTKFLLFYYLRELYIEYDNMVQLVSKSDKLCEYTSTDDMEP